MNTLLIALLWCSTLTHTHNLPQPTPQLHDVQIGSVTVSPSRNVKSFVRKATEFEPNFFEEHYLVAIQFGKLPQDDTWQQLAPDVLPILRIDDQTYHVAIHKNVSKKTLSRSKVQSVIALTPEHKTAPTLQAAFAERPTQKVKVIVSSILPLAAIESRISALQLASTGVLLQDNQRAFLMELHQDDLTPLANEPWVSSITPY